MTASRTNRRRPPFPPLRADVTPPSARARGEEGFAFATPAAKEAWYRSAYNQAVNADTWALGDPMDDQTRNMIELGIAGATAPYYKGPDDRHYFHNARTMEDAPTRAHRAKHVAGKTIDQIAAAKVMPGADEYVAMRRAQSTALRPAVAANDDQRVSSAPSAAAPAPQVPPAAAGNPSVSVAANDNRQPNEKLAQAPDDTVRPEVDHTTPESAVQSPFGMEPGIPRTMLWPDPRGDDGEFTWDVSQWTASSMLYDLARAFVTPAAAAEGGVVTDADVLNLALSIVGGSAVRGAPKAAETLASRQAKLYNGPEVQRPFSKDYPDGHQADAAGNLTHDIDGNPLEIGGRIVGRRMAGGADEALPPTEFDAIAKAGTGRVTQIVPPSAFGRSGTVGQVIADRYTRLPKEVVLSNKLAPDDLPGVYGHEIGHVIDQLAGEIPVGGLSKELKTLYDVANNPNRSQANPDLPADWGKSFTPEAAGYKGDDIPREWMAEAIRLYMANPSYLKEVAPKTAAAIRQAVNRNPETARIIQFNSGGAPGSVPLSDEEWDDWVARGGI